MHVLQSTASSSPPPHNPAPRAPFVTTTTTTTMFRSSSSKKTKQKQPGPTMIPDFPQPTPPIIYYSPPPLPKKKKHTNYIWAPFETFSNHPPPRSRSNSTPHVRFSADTLEREREKDRDRSGRRSSFADYFGRYTHRDTDSRRRYRDYRVEEGHISTLVDPEVQRLGREQRRQQQREEEEYRLQEEYRRHEEYRRQEEEYNRRHHHHHHHRRHSVPDAWPESIYYLGTDDSPPLFLSEREERQRRNRERSLKEFVKKNGGRQSGYEYVERKSLPPGKGLRRVGSFFRGG
ncbi:hypothetical protein K440DRAFT_618073 [Wilcoxina mikolae CBS 423.85]|nr:hypothetical protein K440DRAFT_618073 [Wilcoxina mikolae CBS 423.85]